MNKIKENPYLYLINIGHLHDSELEDFAEENGKTVNELIHDMVYAGWTKGIAYIYSYSTYEYWEN